MLEVEGHGHIPLSAVGEHVAEQELQEAAVEVLRRGGGDDVGEEEVGTFELVPEKDVVLRELEVLDAQVCAGRGAQEVEGGEEPATSGLFCEVTFQSSTLWETTVGVATTLARSKATGSTPAWETALRATVRAVSV